MPKQFWKPWPVQEFALKTVAFELLFGGARGPGKTDTGIVWMVKPVSAFPRYRGLVIRKNSKDLSDWVDRARHLYSGHDVDIVGSPPEFRFKNGPKIMTGHLKDKNAYEQFQGHEYQRILLEELTQIPDEDRYLKLISSCRSTVEGLDARVFCTTNPGGAGHHWVKQRFVDPSPPNKKFIDPKSGRTRIFIPAKVTDNPTLMKSDPDYIKFLDGLPEQLRKAWRDGDWNSFIGMFFSEFNVSEHVYDPSKIKILDSWPRFRSIDWGYSSPLACLWHAVGPERIYTYREFYQTKLLDIDAAQQIARLSDGEFIDYTVGDPSSFPVDVPVWKYGKTMPVKRFQVWAENGVPILMGNNDRINGWSRMREYLGSDESGPRWMISNQCINLIREIGTAVYDDKKVEDLDPNCSDHALDSARYGLMQQPRIIKAPVEFKSEEQAARAWVKKQKTLESLRG